MSTDVDGTTQGETHEQETKHWVCAGLVKHCKIDIDGTREQEMKHRDLAGRWVSMSMDVDGTTQGETGKQETKNWVCAGLEKRCKTDDFPRYEASVKYNRF